MRAFTHWDLFFTHLDTNERRRNAASLQSRVAQSDRNGVPLEPSYAFLCSLALLVIHD